MIMENLKHGSTLVPEEVSDERKSTCYGLNGKKECKYLVRRGPNDLLSKCGACDCYIEVKTVSDTHLLEGLRHGKIKKEKVKCPKGFWGPYSENLQT